MNTTPTLTAARPLLFVGGLALVIAACSGGGGVLSSFSSEPVRELEISSSVADGDLVNADQLSELRVVVEASMDDPEVEPDLADLRLVLDGDDVTAEAERDTDRMVWEPGSLEDGEYEFVVVSVPIVEPGSDGDGEGDGEDADDSASADTRASAVAVSLDDEDVETIEQIRFTVDATPPTIELTSPDGAVVAGDELTVAGTTEPGATVRIGDDEVEADDDGAFELVLDEAPDGELAMTAVDRAGNTSDAEVALVTVPSRATVDQFRSVHVSFCGWAAPSLREPVMELVEAGLINAIQLDLKDETGKVGFDTQNEFAERIGSNTPDCRVNLEAAVEELHGMGVPVIGRIVAFADPVLAPWAWANDERDYAIQTADGSNFYTGRYNGFANFANPEVQEYNIAIAEEAAAMGVDHILWDYLRKPDGPLDNMLVPGMDGSVEDEIVAFTAAADERIAPYGALHGASLYGVSADRPWEVGQDVERLAEVLDYVAPMIYPSHWGPGEYGVANPLMQPYDIVFNNLEVWLEVTEGKRARVAPWLEDSQYPISLGFDSRERYLREQINATYDAGINEWILWDSAVRYTGSGMRLPG